MTASSVGLMRHRNQPHDNRDAFPIAWSRSVQHADIGRCCDLGTMHVGAIASERYSCKKERLPTSKRVRLFGRHNSSRGSTLVAMM